MRFGLRRCCRSFSCAALWNLFSLLDSGWYLSLEIGRNLKSQRVGPGTHTRNHEVFWVLEALELLQEDAHPVTQDHCLFLFFLFPFFFFSLGL